MLVGVEQPDVRHLLQAIERCCQYVEADSIAATVTSYSMSQSRITQRERVIVGNVLVSDVRRRAPVPGA
ncbi:MAG: hypothetical protein JWM76_2295 [Pseudonocardiales bacterium]|nr:hypothetical protein [Pseudonocardiales bacterium]